MSSAQGGEPIPDGEPAEVNAGETEAPLPKHRWGFGAFFLVEAVLLCSAAFIGALIGSTNGQPIPVRNVLIGTIAPTVLAAVVALVITRVRGNGPFRDLQLSWRWDDVRTGLRFGLLGLVFTIVGTVIWTQVVGEQNATSAISALVEGRLFSITAAVTMFLYLWLVGPICEEIIYRGLLWGAVERLHWANEKWGRAAAFLVSTAVFAVGHLEPLRTTLLLVIAVPIGLARLATGRLLGSIVAHQMSNFVPAVAILLTGLGLMPA